jgi:hypothetical protein
MAAAGMLLLGGCGPNFFFETPGYAEAAWANAFAAGGCQQPVEGLAERIARRAEFADVPYVGSLSGARPGTDEYEGYLDIASQSYFESAVEQGVVVLSDDGEQARLLTTECTS